MIMKAALIYTSTTPELMELVEREVKKNIGEEAELISLQNPDILTEVREAGYVTGSAGAKLISMYMEAIAQGADAILNICSSVGEVADCMQDAAKYLGVPIVRIDEEMCREAVRCGKRIGVMATLKTTLEPTKNTIRRAAREAGLQVELEDALVDGAFGLDPQQFRTLMIEHANKIRDKVDVIILAQGSMAYVEKEIERATGRTTLSSPGFGAIELKKALMRKGLIR